MMPDTLQDLLEKHHRWFLKKPGGSRLDLSLADLHGCDLSRAVLNSAKFSRRMLPLIIATVFAAFGEFMSR